MRGSPGAERGWLTGTGLAVLAPVLLVSLVLLEQPFDGGDLGVPRPRPPSSWDAPGTSRHDVLRKGETLEQLASRLGVPRQEFPEWLAAAQGLLNVRALPIGLRAQAVSGPDGAVRSLRLTPDWRSDVVLTRDGTSVKGVREARPVERQVIVVKGSIDSSLFGAVTAAGETEDLALALADLFQWDIDFHRDVQPADSFAVLVERVRAEGVTVAYGPIVAATFVNGGKAFEAYRWAAAGASAGYYDAKGSPTKKLFLRAPLRFTRITSHFSRSRLHPVLGRRMPHWGTDYGAPVGTHVMATASGTVARVGWRTGGGNTVELRHPGGYTTAYLHLSRFAAGIRAGARVEQGQVVGFVGSTGISTGPHLDYRVTRNGAPVNPVTVGREPAPPLPKGELERYEGWRSRLRPLLDGGGAVAPSTWAALLREAPPGLGG